MSNADVNNAGTDNDIFYATRRGKKWEVETVYEADKESVEDWSPAVAVTPDGMVHVAWASDRSTDTTGTDGDLFYARRDKDNWTSPQLLLAAGQTDLAVHFEDAPCMVADRNGDLHVVWLSTFPPAGPDNDVCYVRIHPANGIPSAAPIFLANASGYGTDGGQSSDFTPQVLIDTQGYLHFAWSSNETLAGAIGEDRDVLYARSNLPIATGYTGTRSWERYR
jgi:hypothetical protein